MQAVSGQIADDHQRKNRRDDIDEDFDDLEGHVVVRDETCGAENPQSTESHRR